MFTRHNISPPFAWKITQIFMYYKLCTTQYKSEVGSQKWLLGWKNVSGKHRWEAVSVQVPGDGV